MLVFCLALVIVPNENYPVHLICKFEFDLLLAFSRQPIGRFEKAGSIKVPHI